LEVIDFLNAKQTFGILGSNLNISQNGFPSELQPDLLFKKHLDISKFDPWIHELETNLNFLIFMGCNAITLDDIRPVFWLADSEINHLQSVQTHGRKIIGLFPGASSVEKRWDSSNYGIFAKQMEGQIIYVIFGSSADKDLTDQVAHSIKKCCEDVEILNMTGQTTLRELAKTIMSCNLLISMDTFTLHMAIAAGVPTIGIIGGGHYGRFVPWGNIEKNIFLTKKMDCFNCNWICTHEKAECVKGVSPQEVAIAVTTLFKQHNLYANNNER
jgi:ADP-heptose:LPS heptosyltransferase